MADLQTCVFTLPDTYNADGSDVDVEHLVVDSIYDGCETCGGYTDLLPWKTGCPSCNRPEVTPDPRDRCGISLGLVRDTGGEPSPALVLLVHDEFDIEGHAQILLSRDEWAWVRKKGDALFDERLPTMSATADLAEARAIKRSLRQADAELCRILKDNEALRAENERLKAVIRSMPTTPQTALQAKVALGHTPTRDEIIESMKTPADDCTIHAGALGERCHLCGDVVDGSTKEQRQSLREEIADHVMKDWRTP